MTLLRFNLNCKGTINNRSTFTIYDFGEVYSEYDVNNVYHADNNGLLIACGNINVNFFWTRGNINLTDNQFN